MTDRLLLLLPEHPSAATTAAYWWRVADSAIVEQGTGEDWQQLAVPPTGGAGLPVIALAPVAAVALGWPSPEGITERQRVAIARTGALADALADTATLHAVAGMVDGALATARVSNGDMLEWLDWLSARRIDPLAILPAGLLLPRRDHWTSATLGSEGMLGRDQLLVPDEPAFREMLVGDEDVTPLTASDIDERLVQLTQSLPLNLRTGRFARKRLFVLDWARVRELAALVLLLPLLGLLIALVTLVRLERSSDRLDAETARLASQALGHSVTAATAASLLDARISELPGGSGSPFPPLAAIYQQLQAVPGARAVAVNYRADGTLTASLAAGRAEEINRLLLALQRSGYRVTATTRPGPGGQFIADVAVRSAE